MVYSKIDTFSVMLYGTTLTKILDKLGVDSEYMVSLYNTFYAGLGDCGIPVFRWSYNGIELSIYQYMLDPNSDNMFNSVCQSIRLEVGGKGLDYLRSLGLDVEANFCNPKFWGDDEKCFSITRCDFAYDFVNVNERDFLDLFAYLGSKSSERRLNVGRAGGVSFNLHLGAQCTCYLGSKDSDRYLRIYDKKLEQFKDHIVDANKIPQSFYAHNDADIKSWYRIELQTRRKFATNFCLSSAGDLSSILGKIFEDYLIREDGIPLQCLKNIYDPTILPLIIQNRNYVDSVPVSQKIKNFVETQAFTSIASYVAVYGWDLFHELVTKRLAQVIYDPLYHSQRRGLVHKLSAICTEFEISDSDLNLSFDPQNNTVFLDSIKYKFSKE